MPCKIVLKRVKVKKQTSIPVFALTYDPRLPSFNNIQAKHWKSIKNQDKYIADGFPEPPLTAFK